MNYDPIEIEKDGKYLKFYFVVGKIKRWFYEFEVKNEKDIKSWDEHLQEKMWYTPEVRKEVLSLMRKVLTSIS